MAETDLPDLSTTSNLSAESSSNANTETSSSLSNVDGKAIDKNNDKDTRTTEEIREEISEFMSFKESRKRKRDEKVQAEEENTDILLDVFLRAMYPLNDSVDKTITVGIFKSLNFKPAVLLNQSGKSSILFTGEMWDRFTRCISIIEAYLFNKITGRKTAIGFENSDLEIDNIRLRGHQYVRFRDMSKHNKKILLTFEEFHVLTNLTPIIIRYIQQLTTYGSIISDYLYSSVHSDPVLPLIYGPIDHSIYNRLPQEVSFYRKTGLLITKWRNDKSKQVSTTKDETVKEEEEEVNDTA